MEPGIVIAIVAAAVVLVALLVALPRMRRAREARRVETRREEVVGRHREAADVRHARAELAEKQARHERAEAELHEAQARVHDRGLADEQLNGGGATASDSQQTARRA